MKIGRRQVSADVPAMAMGDIAFLLVIFFVILARAEDDSHLKWVPADIPKIEQLQMSEVRVVIDTDYKVYINGQQTSHELMGPQIEQRLAGRQAGDRRVALKVHRETPAQYFEPVIEAISEAGGELEHVLEEKADK